MPQVIICHLLACLWYLVGEAQGSGADGSARLGWVHLEWTGPQNMSVGLSERYFSSLYKVGARGAPLPPSLLPPHQQMS